MVVLPLFADQYDNAQRILETGFGLRLDPYTFQDQELLEAVEKVLADGELKARLKKASDRILSTDKHVELYQLIEGLVKLK